MTNNSYSMSVTFLRMSFHQTPHKATPGAMIGDLVILRTIMLNWHPAKNGTSKHCGPMTAVTRKKLDFKKHCTVEFGLHVQAVQAHNKHDPTNDTIEWALDRTHPQPNANKQGGHLVMNLNSGKTPTRAR